jgi:hypothetical protein
MKAIIFILIGLSFFSCNKEKIGKHNVECYVQYQDNPCDEVVEIWQGDIKITFSDASKAEEFTLKNGTVNYRISGTTNGFGAYNVGFKLCRKDGGDSFSKYLYVWEIGSNQPYDVQGTFELKK